MATTDKIRNGSAVRNVAAGFVDDDGVFHPIRASYDYSAKRAGEKVKHKGKRNPEEEYSLDAPDARALEDFRGTGPDELLRYQDEQFQDSRDFFAIGRLICLWTAPVPHKTEKDLESWGGDPSDPKTAQGIVPRIYFGQDDCKVLVVEDAHDAKDQIYFIGPGQQTTPEDVLQQLCEGAQAPYQRHAQYQLMGNCYAICYVQHKVFDGDIPTPYGHAFGEENGIVPQLWYDRRRRGYALTGGDYRIERKDAELGASPGIAN
jgi:hypothetical protein